MNRFSPSLIVLAIFFAIPGPIQGQHLTFLPFLTKEYCPNNLIFLAFGDSITSGYYDTTYSNCPPIDPIELANPNCGYPSRLLQLLKNNYGRNFAFHNQGNGGETTGGGLARFEATITKALPSPELILIMEGTNDFLGDHGVPFEEVDANLRAMVGMAQSQGKRVILATNPPVWNDPNEFDRTLQAERIAAFRDWIFRIGADYQIPVVDVWAAFVSHSNWEGDYMSNGNHPNSVGYSVIAQAFDSKIEQHMTSNGCYIALH